MYTAGSYIIDNKPTKRAIDRSKYSTYLNFKLDEEVYQSAVNLLLAQNIYDRINMNTYTALTVYKVAVMLTHSDYDFELIDYIEDVIEKVEEEIEEEYDEYEEEYEYSEETPLRPTYEGPHTTTEDELERGRRELEAGKKQAEREQAIKEARERAEEARAKAEAAKAIAEREAREAQNAKEARDKAIATANQAKENTQEKAAALRGEEDRKATADLVDTAIKTAGDVMAGGAKTDGTGYIGTTTMTGGWKGDFTQGKTGDTKTGVTSGLGAGAERITETGLTTIGTVIIDAINNGHVQHTEETIKAANDAFEQAIKDGKSIGEAKEAATATLLEKGVEDYTTTGYNPHAGVTGRTYETHDKQEIVEGYMEKLDEYGKALEEENKAFQDQSEALTRAGIEQAEADMAREAAERAEQAAREAEQALDALSSDPSTNAPGQGDVHEEPEEPTCPDEPCVDIPCDCDCDCGDCDSCDCPDNPGCPNDWGGVMENC